MIAEELPVEIPFGLTPEALESQKRAWLLQSFHEEENAQERRRRKMIHGIEIHDCFRDRLESAFTGKVHSVFERVINFTDDTGAMYALLADSLDRGPDALILDIRGLDTLDISSGDRILSVPEGLRVGHHLIDISKAEPYRLRLPDYSTDAVSLRPKLAFANARIQRMAAGKPTPFLVRMDHMVEERKLMLKEAMRKGDLLECTTLGRKLLGLGQGLTPTGDDILLGLFCVIHMGKSPLERLKGLPEAVLQGTDRMTNDLSLWGLKRAAKGQVREDISDFLRDLGQGKEIGESLETLLQIGHSSGRDIASGILTGFELIVEEEVGNR